MNALTDETWPRARRTAALDPFGPPVQDEANASGSAHETDSYGCVDWYVYGVAPVVCQARKPAVRGGELKLSEDQDRAQ